MPDLTRMAHRKMRVPYTFPLEQLSLTTNKKIYLGCKRHVQIDALWHNSLAFGRLNTEVANLISEHDFSVNRKNFFCHILVELAIDRAMLQKNYQIGEEFYEKLEQINQTEVEAFLNRFPKLFTYKNHFLKFYNHFMEERFLLLYVERDQFHEVVRRVYFRGTSTDLGISFQKFLPFLREVDMIFKENLEVVFLSFTPFALGQGVS